jgi:hypothetical protein
MILRAIGPKPADFDRRGVHLHAGAPGGVNEPSATPSNGKNRAATVPALLAHAFLSRRTLRLRGGPRQLSKLVVADFGLGHQDTAAKMLDQVGAD